MTKEVEMRAAGRKKGGKKEGVRLKRRGSKPEHLLQQVTRGVACRGVENSRDSPEIHHELTELAYKYITRPSKR